MLSGIVLQAFATPKPSHRTATSPKITRFQLPTVQWRRSLHHFRRRLAFTGEMFALWAAAHPWNPIPLYSRRTVMALAGQIIALRNSWVIVSLDVWRVSRTIFFKSRRSLSVIKRGLPGHDFVVVEAYVSTSQSRHQPSTWATWEGLQCPWQISYWCGNQQLVHIEDTELPWRTHATGAA
jgi:hypothetical protein